LWRVLEASERAAKDCTLQMSHMEAVRNALGCTQNSPVKSDSDALALAIHAALESDGLALVSINENEAGKDSGAAGPAHSIPLPSGWNSSQDVYTFHYRLEGSPALVVVKSLVMEETMLVHAASDKADDMHTLELRSSFFGTRRRALVGHPPLLEHPCFARAVFTKTRSGSQKGRSLSLQQRRLKRRAACMLMPHLPWSQDGRFRAVRAVGRIWQRSLQGRTREHALSHLACTLHPPVLGKELKNLLPPPLHHPSLIPRRLCMTLNRAEQPDFL
jgi:hypothetical protein